MSLNNWILLMFGIALYPRSSAKFCMRQYVDGRWVSEGDCEGPEMMSEIMKELQLRAEDEKKRTKEFHLRAEEKKKKKKQKKKKKKRKRISDKKWTVFQRRMNGDVEFYRGWDDYVKGFGNSDGDFWLGLEPLHQMTKGGNIEMKIKMITRDRFYLVVKYSDFRIGPVSENYRLTVSGYSGNATRDALVRHNNRQFSTKDADHDLSSKKNCAAMWEGGWWYGTCGYSNLNGNFHKTDRKGFWWDGYSFILLRYSEMKFRRIL